MYYLVANWKSEMDFHQVKAWCFTFLDSINYDIGNLNQQEIKVILGPSYLYLRFVQQTFSRIPFIYIASQDVSPLGKGKYTGFVPAESVKDFCEYAIVGHSERRKHARESEEEIKKKLAECKKHGVKTILCVRETKDQLYASDIVAYEPVEAIGTGANADATHVVEMKKKLKPAKGQAYLYGGSADDKNIDDYLATGEVDGFLVGTASLDPKKFFAMFQKMLGNER
ncbi:triosephosphate isomerase [Candidatus Woesebacteria bacterium]|nr:triosephosphate isomerase [Candidatus Woesebacteria bacterium]